MPFDYDHIVQLFYRHAAGTLTTEDREQWQAFTEAYPALAQHLHAVDASDELRELFVRRSPAAENNRREQMLADIFRKINESDANGKTRAVTVHRVHLLKTAWFRYVAAIILLIGLGTAGYYVIQSINKSNNNATTITEIKASTVLPGTNKAVLTLSNGRRVTLDSASSETINDQQLSIQNNNGRLIYGPGRVLAMNTMTTPKGGQYQLTLADGSRVWLNAASRITYPTAFSGKTREVQITGEAYFEVIKNAAAPFIVKTPTDVITVLGTAFNVHAYADEAAVKTSLINGSVNVNDTNIKPGQAYSQGKVTLTNTDQDIAWKNGYISFDNKKLSDIMNEIERWYDVEVLYPNGVPVKEFVGKVDRKLTLAQVLNGLQKVGLNIRIENDKRIVILR